MHTTASMTLSSYHFRLTSFIFRGGTSVTVASSGVRHACSDQQVRAFEQSCMHFW